MAQRVKNPPAMEETWVRSLGQKHPLKKEMATTPVLLPGESLDRFRDGIIISTIQVRKVRLSV